MQVLFRVVMMVGVVVVGMGIVMSMIVVVSVMVVSVMRNRAMGMMPEAPLPCVRQHHHPHPGNEQP